MRNMDGEDRGREVEITNRSRVASFDRKWVVRLVRDVKAP